MVRHWRNTRKEETVEEVVRRVFACAMKGQLWAVRAIREAVEGTVDGSPPPIDQDALVDAGLSAKQIVREIRRAYLATLKGAQ